MAKKDFKPCSCDKAILGNLICMLRKENGFTLRRFAKAINLPPSNLSYIENGTNVPSAEVYQKIIEVLNPDIKRRKELDKLYMAIRKIPPPDICEVLLHNFQLGEKIRLLSNLELSSQQLSNIEKLFVTFKNNTI